MAADGSSTALPPPILSVSKYLVFNGIANDLRRKYLILFWFPADNR